VRKGRKGCSEEMTLTELIDSLMFHHSWNLWPFKAGSSVLREQSIQVHIVLILVSRFITFGCCVHLLYIYACGFSDVICRSLPCQFFKSCIFLGQKPYWLSSRIVLWKASCLSNKAQYLSNEDGHKAFSVGCLVSKFVLILLVKSSLFL